MTKEENLARIQRQKAERQEWKRRFPEATIDNTNSETHGVTVQLKQGDARFLTVSVRGEGNRNTSYPDTWSDFDIRLTDDPFALAQFIAALAARYNEMVNTLNSATYGVYLKTVDPINT